MSYPVSTGGSRGRGRRPRPSGEGARGLRPSVLLLAMVTACSSRTIEPGPEEDVGVPDASGDAGVLDSGADADGLAADGDVETVDEDSGPAEDAGPDGDAEAPPEPEPTWEELQLESSRMALDGIVRYVGSHYQSCAPLLYLDLLPTKAMEDHFGLPTSHTYYDRCVDRRDADFRYLTFGNIFEDIGDLADGETSLDPNAGRMRLHDGEIDSFLRVHCTGALAGSVASGNMKYYVGQTKRDYSPNTIELETLIRDEEHCFVSPTMTRDLSLLPGDIINVSAGHAVRVFQIGEDPLGLKRVETVEDCDSIRRRDFDFYFVHSSSTDLYSGVHFQHTSGDTPSLIGTLADAVRQMCRESFVDGDIRGELPHLYLGDREFLGGLVVKEMHFRVLRHVGPRVPECVWDPEMPVRGDDCLRETCYDEVMAAGYFPPAP